MTPDELQEFTRQAEFILAVLRDRLGDEFVSGATVEMTPNGKPIVGIHGEYFFLNRTGDDVAAARAAGDRVEYAMVGEDGTLDWCHSLPMSMAVESSPDAAQRYQVQFYADDEPEHDKPDARWN